MTDPETHAEQEAFAKRLGVALIDVWFMRRRGPEPGWVLEPQVDDHETFLTTVSMSLARHGARFALWYDDEMWCLLDTSTNDTKRYPSRDAAEMVAIHVR